LVALAQAWVAVATVVGGSASMVMLINTAIEDTPRVCRPGTAPLLERRESLVGAAESGRRKGLRQRER
jgi:hypothetical protein